MKVIAEDKDEPGSANSDIKYKILTQDPERPSANMFFINPTTGGIQLNSDGLDRDVCHPLITGSIFKNVHM